jgi:SAM-dependent methyltransferase
MTFSDAKQRFSSRVADYLRYRPGYPKELLDLLWVECGLRAKHIVADIGSGTGLLSEPFLKYGNSVVGVEPNAEMRAGGEHYLAEYENFRSVDGSAEATGLADASVDFVTAGQSFHWFDAPAAKKEFLRILRPGGWVVVTWNDRRMEEKTLTREYEGLLEQYGVDYKNVKDAYPEWKQISDFFAPGKVASRDLENFQDLDCEGLRGRLLSSSFAPTPPHANYAPMLARLESIFQSHQRNGRVRMQYFTRVYFGQLAAPRAHA